MGVHGLWRLIEPSGKPVPVESLENKVLAVDVSIWLHQAIKGFQDAKGAPALNAHLLGVFHRVCKLLYFKIKPVFVFDGGVPTLKRETIAKRNQLKHKNISEADKIQKQLLDTLIKHSAINKVLADKAKAAIATTASSSKETEDIFKLPEVERKLSQSNSEDEGSGLSDDESNSPTKHWNLHNIDTKSQHFKTLPADVRHEILTELKETRKQSSWGRLHELPTQSDDFSGFQMQRLLKRQEVQLALEEAEKEMGGHTLSLVELEEILKDQGVIAKNVMGSRIASDENTRYLYIRDVKKALEKARREDDKKLAEIKEETEEEPEEKALDKADLELEKDIQAAIVLSLQEQPSSSSAGHSILKKKLSEFSFLEDIPELDSDESEDDLLPTPTPKGSKMSSAVNYMKEYSGLNPNEITRIVSENEKKKPIKRKTEEVKQFAEEIKNDAEMSVVKKRKVEVLEPIKEVPEVTNELEKTTEFMSGSEDSDDFEEVKDEIMEVDTKNIMEIKIEKDFNEEEDLFADIFTEEDEVKKTVEILNSLQKIETSAPESETNLTSHHKEIFEKIEDKTVEIKEDEILCEKTIEVAEMKEKLVESEKKIEKTEEVKHTEIVPFERPTETSELLKDIIKRAETLKTYSKSDSDSKIDKLSEDDLKKIQNDLNKEKMELRNEQGFRERLGTNITDQMYKEAQDLLELFGLPYIIAPMEAEAQCAFLELSSLTDGTITDDSDIWLFGGKTVYKNFFNQSKHVLEYRAENIKHHFKLSREQMILLALLVGSDYTTGLQGVGPVTAMEILAAFPSSNTSTFTLSHNQLLVGLSEFKNWFVNGKSIARGKDSLRNKLKNIKFTESFPSEKVVDAYLNPVVDPSEEQFTWSKPDFEALIEFSRSKFGWNQTKTDTILKPVIKRMKETKYQSNLLNYFKIKHNLNAEEAQKLMSARVKSAVERIGKDPKEIEDEQAQTAEKSEVKKSSKTKSSKRRKRGIDAANLSLDEDFVEIEQIEAFLEKIKKDEGSKEKDTQPISKKIKKNKAGSEKQNESTENQISKYSDDAKPSTSKLEKDDVEKSKIEEKQVKKTTVKRYRAKNKVAEKLETVDQEIEVLNQTEALSEKRVEEIESEAKKKLESELKKRTEADVNIKKAITRSLHRKEVIPQRERDQRNIMRAKLKAIEIYRKTKIDPTSKKKNLKAQTPKDDAGLSESSDSDL